MRPSFLPKADVPNARSNSLGAMQQQLLRTEAVTICVDVLFPRTSRTAAQPRVRAVSGTSHRRCQTCSGEPQIQAERGGQAE